jgi:hypothetical protein
MLKVSWLKGYCVIKSLNCSGSITRIYRGKVLLLRGNSISCIGTDREYSYGEYDYEKHKDKRTKRSHVNLIIQSRNAI